jgi:hypothetical protein
MDKFVFLDLEGTVCSLIENQQYSTTDYGNLPKVRQWLEKEGVTAVGIFSFAIDNAEERDTFRNSWLRKGLEEQLDVQIFRIVTVEDVKADIERRKNIRIEFLWEVKQLYGKEIGFIEHCRANYRLCECVLLDDMVDNMILHTEDRQTGNQLVIRTVNVDTI